MPITGTYYYFIIQQTTRMNSQLSSISSENFISGLHYVNETKIEIKWRTSPCGQIPATIVLAYGAGLTAEEWSTDLSATH